MRTKTSYCRHSQNKFKNKSVILIQDLHHQNKDTLNNHFHGRQTYYPKELRNNR